jgi:crotonobetainyl-CoA:carnitine CoA-transferase CaiB-like acyl-CoA transferase
MSTPSMPLTGFTVIDLTAHRAGPTAVRQLADWGADVIKIEMPGEHTDATGSRRDGPDFQNLHRNKRSLSLDLKTPEGKKIFFQLAAKADVIVENFKSTVKHRLGVDARQSGRSIRASSTAASRALARTAPMRAAPGSTRSPRAWAG